MPAQKAKKSATSARTNSRTAPPRKRPIAGASVKARTTKSARASAKARGKAKTQARAKSSAVTAAKPTTARRRTRTQTSSQATHSGFMGFFTAASTRAHQRTNQRNYRSRNLKSLNAAIAQEADDEYTLPTVQLIFRTLVAIILIFPCFISTAAIFEINTAYAESDVWSQLLASREFRFFSIGGVMMLGLFFTQLAWDRFLFFYVLGHELTHAFFIFLCGGKVSGFKVTQEGGYVITNKTNILIALSPYFVPFWSVIALGLSYLLRLAVDIPFHTEVLYYMIGFSWTFHLVWTLWMIPRDQPDLKENGSFFSLTIIYLANILLLALLLCLSPSGITLKEYCYQWVNLCLENGLDLISFFKSL